MKPYYSKGGISIFLGDCRTILPSLIADSFECVVTSPPYNQMGSMKGKPSGMMADTHGGLGFHETWNARGYEDELNEDDYQRGQQDLFSSILSRCTPTASLFYNHQLRWRAGACLHPVQWFRPSGWNLRQEIIWDRGGGLMLNARMFVRCEERILWFVRSRWKWDQSQVGFGTIWRLAREQKQQGKTHPVEFPIEIPLRCIAASTDPGDEILDPYCGSGTTLVAAKQLGRRAVGIEIVEQYAESAAHRLEQGILNFEETK